MDEVFGVENFRNDITRIKCNPKNFDRIGCFVPIHAPGETENGNSSKPFNGILPPAGRHWRTDVQTLEEWDKAGLIEWSSTGNPRKIIFADEREGKRVQDIWEFKDPQYPVYPTEKNADILDLIIRTSSNKNSIVLDCFCGSGTTLLAAQKNNRQWIGIDESDLAIEATKDKLNGIESDLFSDISFEITKLELLSV